MLVAHSCDGCSSAPSTKYKNYPIYQEITDENKFTNTRDDRIYIDMRRRKGYTDELEKINCDDSSILLTINLKETAAKKLRFRITRFSQAEYWCLLSNKGYIMSYKNCNISRFILKMLRKYTPTESYYKITKII